MRDHVSTYGRIRVICLAAIVLASIALCVVSFRTVRNEEIALVERMREDHRGIAGLMARQLSPVLKDVQAGLSTWDGSSDGLGELESEFPYVRYAFVRDRSGKLVYPPFARERETLVRGEILGSPAFVRAREYEFEEGRLDLAQYEYLGARAEGLTGIGSVVALHGAGRCALKLQRYRDAVDLYGMLVESCPKGMRLAGVPAEAVGRLQLIRAHEGLGQTDRAEGEAQELYGRLLSDRWRLSDGQYRVLLARTRSHLPASSPDPEQERRTVRKRAFFRQVAGTLEGIGTSGPDIRVSRVDSATYVMCTVHDEVLVGAFLDRALLSAAFEEHLAALELGANVVAAVAETDGGILAGPRHLLPGPVSARRAIWYEMPLWEVRIYPSDPEALARMARTRRRLHMAVVLVAVGAILSGLYFTLRSVSKEMELARLRTEFVSNVSHELKTPLTSIRMFGEMLKLGRVSRPEKRQTYYEIITSESERLSHLIDNVLDFSRIEEGRKRYEFRIEPVGEVIASAVERFRRLMKSRVEIEADVVPELPKLEIDRDALTQALFNLLDNAAKYSGEDPRVRVETSAENGWILVRVIDWGIGIDRQDQERIFDKFYRAHTMEAAQAGGSGLGLTLVRHIAQAHGGDVSVSSVRGRGSTFTIRIPVDGSVGRKA